MNQLQSFYLHHLVDLINMALQLLRLDLLCHN
jgi:hypothetical protein